MRVHPWILPINIVRYLPPLSDEVESFENLGDECVGLMEFNAKVGNRGLRLIFGVPKGEVDVSE